MTVPEGDVPFSLNFTSQLRLDAVLLHEAQVTRGEASHTGPGRVKTNFEVTYEFEERPLFIVTANGEFSNKNDDLLADIAVSFAVLYEKEGDFDPSEDEIQEFVDGLLMIQVLPFIREFFATMTNRMGLPAFFLPLFRFDRKINLRRISEAE